MIITIYSCIYFCIVICEWYSCICVCVFTCVLWAHVCVWRPAVDVGHLLPWLLTWLMQVLLMNWEIMESISLDSQFALLEPVSSFQIRGSYADHHTPTSFMVSENWNPEFLVPVANKFYTRPSPQPYLCTVIWSYHRNKSVYSK